MLNKREELSTLISIHHYDVIVITETLPKNRENCEIQRVELQLDGYNLFCKDPGNYNGRGVAIYIRDNINASLLEVEQYQHIEVVGVKIRLINNDWLFIQGLYRSPNSSNECTREL